MDETGFKWIVTSQQTTTAATVPVCWFDNACDLMKRIVSIYYSLNMIADGSVSVKIKTKTIKFQSN